MIRYYIVIALLGLTSACSSPAQRYYTLSTPIKASAQSVPAATANSFSVAVGRVTVPEAVDRPSLVMMLGDNRVNVLESHVWVESLKREIPRVVAENLTQILPSARVATFPQFAAENADFTVALDVQRFDSLPGEAAIEDVTWSIVKGKTNTPVRSARSLVREVPSGGSYEALVAAHSRALAKISNEIGAAIRAEAAR